MDGERNIQQLLEENRPGLFEEIKKTIQASEADFTGQQADSHLWEHSLLVASLVLVLAPKEGIDPLVPVITALLHDAGKFSGRGYHTGREPEEMASLSISREILGRFHVGHHQFKEILGSLQSLYQEKTQAGPVTDLIHDADFLAKSGYLGIGVFFSKGTLRGKNLLNWIMASASRELTYAKYLPGNMRTEAGKKMAEREKNITRTFFNGLFRELKDKGILDLIRREFTVSPPGIREEITLSLVLPRSCQRCRRDLKVAFSYETGIKCERVTVLIHCSRCREKYQTSFCLPEIAR